MQKPAVTTKPIHDLLANRWSPLAFNAEKPVSADQIVSMLEAARWAPSCFGAEPWHFIVCDRSASSEAWKRLHGCLADGNKGWAASAPLLILSVGRRHFALNGKPNRHYAYDTGAAAISLVLQAEALGLRAHQMGGFDPDKAMKVFGIPEDGYECLSVTAVGHQAEAASLEEPAHVQREEARRMRNPMGEHFFNGFWGQAYTG